MKNGKLVVCVDVDDTLIIPGVVTGSGRDTPNYDTIAVFKWFEAQGAHMVIWSGSGIDWATTWAEKLGLKAEIRMKQKYDDVDLVLDDCDVTLGKINIKVKRIENSVSRAEWNKTKRNDGNDTMGCGTGRDKTKEEIRYNKECSG